VPEERGLHRIGQLVDELVHPARPGRRIALHGQEGLAHRGDDLGAVVGRYLTIAPDYFWIGGRGDCHADLLGLRALWDAGSSDRGTGRPRPSHEAELIGRRAPAGTRTSGRSSDSRAPSVRLLAVASRTRLPRG